MSAWRPDLIGRPPGTWDDVVELARDGRVSWPLGDVDAAASFLTLAAVAGAPCATRDDHFVDRDVALWVLETMRSVASVSDQRGLHDNPIDVLEALAHSGTYVYSPLLFCYVSYSRAGHPGAKVAYGDIPTIAAGQAPLGSLLGGAGLAVSAYSPARREALDYSLYVASSEVQCGAYFASGGQPAHPDAWSNPQLDRESGGFFSGTGRTMNGAWDAAKRTALCRFPERHDQPFRPVVRRRAGSRPLSRPARGALPGFGRRRQGRSVRTTGRVRTSAKYPAGGEQRAERAAEGDGAAVARTTTGDLLALLEELATFDRIGVTRLSQHLGVPVATAYRMLRALERTGFAEQLSESKEYRLTLKLFELGCQVASRTTMRDVAAIEIERLAQQAGTAAQAGVLVDNYVLYLGKVETDEVITLNWRPGSRLPATCTAMGKAMLAAEGGPVRAIVGDGPYPARTEHSITTYEALSSELAIVQSKGYAVDRQELSLGLWCVAAPIAGTRLSQNGAVSIATYGVELSDSDCERYGRLVIACAGRIARKSGSLDDMHSWVSPRTSYPRP